MGRLIARRAVLTPNGATRRPERERYVVVAKH